MRPSVKLIVLAAAVAVLAAAPPLATASTSRSHAAAPTATLAGSVLPSVAHSALLGHASPAAAVQVSLVLRPSHPALLARMAARSSARPGLSPKLMNALFRPAPSVRAQVAAYMRARGFRAAGSGLLTMTFTGNAVQAERAFGVSLNRYRLAGGTAYRAPSGAIHLPPALAARVISVDGLSTLPLMRPLGLKRSKSHLTPQISPGHCLDSDNTQSGTPGSLQPADLASANGYNSQPLLTANWDGTGESVALVEFANYFNADQTTYQTCYGTAVPVNRVNVNGGTTIRGGGSIEVALDQEVLAGEAPGLDHIWTYVAKPSASMATVLDAILRGRATHHVHIVSDSWGNCEPLLLEATQAANNRELQLMAVAGMSFFAASGDDGSSDCHSRGFDGLAVDDPAVQPYATGVGGTNLHIGSGHNETVWGGHGVARGGGGGGVSLSFLKPSWQKGLNVIRSGSSRTRCGGKTRFCREVPDVAFDADPATGYVINATNLPGWDVVGGTSAAAPLMAAFTADANEFSRGNGGTRMGFASPFLYHEFTADPPMFHDVTSGTNNIFGGTKYTAGPGYDLATGLGSVDANVMAVDLSNYTRAAVHVHRTKITASASRNPVTAGHPTILSGKLTDTTSHTALRSRVVWIEGFLGKSPVPVFLRVHTGPHGGWSQKLTRTQIRKRFLWHAVYVGEQGHGPAISRTHVLHAG